MICPSCLTENDEAAEVCFTCRSVLKAITRGTVIASRYEVLSPLGRGGMGTVYKARDRVLDEDVAVKVLRSDLADTPEAARRSLQEIKLARTVSHWNVCRIHEYGEEAGLRYISMELVEGETLKQVVRRRGALPAAEALDVAIQIVDGLEAIHKAGIVHRDLTSLNVTVDVGNRVRVMDFGIAKRAAAGTTSPTTPGYVVGNPEYMSPEQARGRVTDFRSDVYSLGIVLYEILMGVVPFRGDSPVATLLLHVEAAPPLDTPKAAAIPPALVSVLKKTLAKGPGDRYETAKDVAAALRAVRSSVTSETDLGRGRRRWLTPPAIGAGIAIALAGLTFLLSRPVGEQPAIDASPSAPGHLPTPVATATEPPLPEAEGPSPSASPPVAARPRRDSPPTKLASPRVATPVPEPIPARPTVPPSTAPVPAAETRDDPQSASSPAPATEEGFLLVTAEPWADVSVDGQVIGQTPLGKIRLGVGSHDVVLTHPDYLPFRRRVNIRPSETFRLKVQFPADGVRRGR